MIKIFLWSDKGKVATKYKEKEIKFSDVIGVIYEFERIKKELLEKKFELDYDERTE